MSLSKRVLNLIANSPLRDLLAFLGLIHVGRTAYRRGMRVATGGIMTVTIADVSVDFAPPDPLIGSTRFQDPEAFDEAPLIRDMLAELAADDVVLDVGAHIGYHACFAAEAVSDGAVHAVEAHPANALEVLRNSRLNGHDVRVHSYALSNESGSQDLSVAADDAGGSTYTLAETGRESITVATHRADDVLDVQPTVIKIDVEGAEQLVLEGMDSILSSPECRVVYCELHEEGGANASIEDLGGSIAEVESILEGHGFEVEELCARRSGKYRSTDIKAVKESTCQSRGGT